MDNDLCKYCDPFSFAAFEVEVAAAAAAATAAAAADTGRGDGGSTSSGRAPAAGSLIVADLNKQQRAFVDAVLNMLTFDELMFIKHRLRMSAAAGQPIKLLIG
ncbi:hypothetical protein COO60DRAFT_1647909 [Scenedesmus sp. NREL 46B-D3]|nr:hypothetical protein COO60DRAFT_1647909 [Scenedesmus sp. NREL 46B-D3]